MDVVRIEEMKGGWFAGNFEPTAWKTEVFELAQWKNLSAGSEIIPASIITKPPSAELRPDQRDDQTLPDYETLDALLKELVENDKVNHELIASGYDPEITSFLWDLSLIHI